MFSVNFVTADSYQASPILDVDPTFSDFRGKEIKHVPIIRIFGSTSAGNKACLHVHGVFPYIYIPCTIAENTDNYAYRLASAIDTALNVSLGCANSSNHHVYKIQKISGIPYYGYHQNKHWFYKVYFYNPALIKRTADLLQNGAILNQSLQPYEAHIPFIQQFMIDYNLYGMSFINISHVKHRCHIQSNSNDNIETKEHSRTDSSHDYLPVSVARQSICEYEVDALSLHILNPNAMKDLELNPGIATIWEEEKMRRIEMGLPEVQSQLLYPETSIRPVQTPTANDIYQEQRLLQRLQIISQTNDSVESTSTSASTYPVQVENDEETSQDDEKSKFLVTHLGSLDSFTSVASEIASSSELIKASESFLDVNDLKLLDMLNSLIDHDEIPDVVDNDSVLGSQNSMFKTEVKIDNDDDDVEDLNITCFELDTLSSWGSVGNSQASNGSKNEKQAESNKKENNDKNCDLDFSNLQLPQYDGADHLYSAVADSRMQKTIPQSKNASKKLSKCQGTRQNKRKTNPQHTSQIRIPLKLCDKNLSQTEERNHFNLDVCDVHIESITDGAQKSCDEKLIDEKVNIIPSENVYRNIVDNKNLKIPALDGNTIISSSDSDTEADITISREEERICTYNSGRKSVARKMANITPGKRKRSGDPNDLDFSSPNKRSAADTAPKSVYASPKRRNMTQSLSSPRNYVPLNITVSSPRTSRTDRDDRLNSKTNVQLPCLTPKRKTGEICEDLIQRNIFKSSIQKNIGKNVYKNVDVECEPLNNENESFIAQNDVETDKQIAVDGDDNIFRNDFNKTANQNKSNKDVCKRLNFYINDEEKSDSDMKNTTLACSSNDERRDCNVMTDGLTPKNDKSISAEINKDDDDHKLIENRSGKNELNIETNTLQNIKNQQTIINDSDGMSGEESSNVCPDEEDSCDMTFTQCINEKLKDNQSLFLHESVCHRATDGLVVITPKFRPASKEYIKKNMSSYNILQSGYEELFGDKRKKGALYKISDCPDIQSFKSSLDGVIGIKRWRRMKVNELHPSGASLKSNNMKRVLAGYNLVTIKPLLAPPTLKSVRTWLKAKEYLATKDQKAQDRINAHNKPNESQSSEVNKANDNIEKEIHSCDSNKSSVNGSHSMDFSVEKILKNPSLLKDTQASEHLGISHGQIEGLSKNSSINISDQNRQNAKALTVYRYITLLCVEMHIATRGNLLPDPLHDSIEAVFYAIENDVPDTFHLKQKEHGAIIVGTSSNNVKLNNIHSANVSCPIKYVACEEDLFLELITLIRQCDPDILMGWEIETLSWGYIVQRAFRLNVKNFSLQISRIPNVTLSYNAQEQDTTFPTEVKIPGRIILDIWRIMRHEADLLIYTFENVMYNIMHERISCPSFKTLTDWWKHSHIKFRYKVIDHYLTRILGTLRLISQLDIIGRTSEHARLFGIQFYEVFSRGSQFRVESIMLRLAKPLNYIAISPSVHQRAKMRAPEALPLIMEPKSTFYTDPLIVLDFQSLYPSMIIAYNYCFSTCLGRIEHIGQNDPFEFGAATLKVRKHTALKLQQKLNFSPCGVAFVKPEVRQGILPRMLTEILNTRLMVKASMKLHGNGNSLLQRVLDSQQLGLKLIANVTYGYTSANFSGRMPCIEVGDSVVSKGRETLERAIKIVESTPKWGAQVVYGDTDSLFILVPGKTRKEAFDIGAEIADTVTAANPRPVKLKFEKVLHPAILQTKKRYCGYMYESVDQKEPEYLAKGIETVRRDGCPAVAKILEKSLRILFETGDISLIKKYVTRQLDKVLSQRVSIQDLTYAKEFRGLHGYKPTACVPALELTRRLTKKDPRAIPRTSERVRYVIVAGAPNQPLIQCVRTPWEVMNDPGLTPNAIYYVTKAIIPPLNRCFNLIGVDINTWYREMSHRYTLNKAVTFGLDSKKSTICQFFNTIVCATCGEQSYKDICSGCMEQPNGTLVILHEKLRWLERTYHHVNAICQSCTGCSDDPTCMSLDCPVLYRNARARQDLAQISYLQSILERNQYQCDKSKS